MRKNTIRTLGIALLVFFLNACDGGTAVNSPFADKTHFENSLHLRERTLPNTIDYDDFYKVSYNMGMVEVDEFLSDNNITIKGSGNNRYLLRADLLRVCGQECTGDDGLGKILWVFAVYKQKR